MPRIYKSSTELIGKTPLAELMRIEEKYKLKAKIYAKLEYFNPAGSVKDRVALGMIDKAEKDGKLVKNSVIVEPTSGNTGIGIAAAGVAKGYRVVIVMPETMSVERRNLIAAYGAEVVLSEGASGMKGAIAKAEEIAQKENGIILGQFVNPANPDIHYRTTGPEIYADMDGDIDFFVAGVGTGGTITGVGKYLKEKIAGVGIIAVEPEKSPVLSSGKSGAHGIQGIGAGFVPPVLDTSVYDEVITVSDADAYSFGRDIAKTEGYLVGISSGAALKAAVEIASRPENAGKKIVTLFPDSGDRYLSTPLFSAENNR